MGARIALDIVVWMTEYMIRLGKVQIYNWAELFLLRIQGFIFLLKHKGFYISQLVIALFLDLVYTQAPSLSTDKF